MKEKIEQLSKGIFTYRMPQLCLPEKIEVSVETGKVFSGSLLIRNEKNTRMKGVIYSSSRWFVIEDDKFIGEANEIHYHVDAAYLNAGDVVQGVMSVVSDCGEAAVPFTVMVEAPYCMSSLGRIKDMFQFTNLARSNPAEAKELFGSEDFERMLAAYDRKYLVLYRHLKGSRSRSQALEEFLICIHKKLQIHFSVDKTSFSYENCRESFSEKITVSKDNWGFAELRVSSDAEFVQPDHKILWTDNFVGDTCSLEFVVDASKLRDGMNRAKITLRSIYQEIEIAIECRKPGNAAEHGAGAVRTIRNLAASLTGTYMRFRLNEISVSRYIQESREVLDRLLSFQEDEYLESASGDDSMLRFELYRIHLNLVAGKENKSRAQLKALAQKKEELRQNAVFEYCALLYLEALHQKSEEYVQKVCGEIWEIYQKENNSWEILWFLLYLDKRYDLNPELKLSDIRAQFNAGCHSPVLYYEAASIYRDNAALLKDLGQFEIQVMHFAARKGMISRETASCITCLAAREKDFQPLIFEVLLRCYEKYSTKDTLSAICSMLIKGNKTEEMYFPWFERGVEEQLRILELYEYYMYTLPENIKEPIASPVLTYFVYNNNLNDRKKDYLFANLIGHKEEQGAMYRSYRAQIEEHAKKQLKLGNLNPYLAVVYDDVINRDTITAEMVQVLPNLVFQYDLECSNPGIRQVLVVHKEDEQEVITPLVNGIARVELYTSDAEILLIDQNENRYSATVEYKLYPLMHAGDYLKRCYELGCEDRRLVLNLAEKAQGYQKFDEDSIALRLSAVENEEISGELRSEYLDTLVHYYYDNFENELLDGVLKRLDLHFLPQAERKKMIELLIVRDMYRQAADAIAEFGSDEIQVKRLIKLSWYFIREKEDISGNRVFLEVCYSIFLQGKYDETVLNYLVQNFYGTTFEMHQIWKAARSFELDTFVLEDRLLAQMLFAENFIEESVPVFRSYYRNGCSRKLVRAALSYYAYCFLMERRPLTQELFDIMKRELGYEENDVCRLAILKYYSEQELLTDSELKLIDLELIKMAEKGIKLPFFARFGDKTRISRSMQDKCMVQYRAEPGMRLALTWTVVRAGESQEKKEELLSRQGRGTMMEHVFCGIYVSEFVLFRDEELVYEISEMTQSGPNSLARGVMRMAGGGTDGASRYGLLNRIMESEIAGDDDTAMDRIGQYIRTDYVIRKVFRPIERP